MRTTTVRLDDDLLLLVQKLGSLTERGTADVIRDALRAYLEASAVADGNEAFRTFAQGVAERRLAASRSQLEETIGDLLPRDVHPTSSSTIDTPEAEMPTRSASS